MTTEIQKTITDTILNLDRELREISLKVYTSPALLFACLSNVCYRFMTNLN